MTINMTEIIRKTMGWCPLLNMRNIEMERRMEYAYVSGIKGSLTAGESYVHEEKAPYSRAIKMILAIGSVSLALLVLFSSLWDAPQQAQTGLFAIALVFVLIIWSFFSIRFRITSDSVEAVMPPFRYHVPFSEIKDVKTIENIPWYVGWGLRLWGRRLAFVSMRKSAVEIKRKRGFFRRLVLTTRNPEEFAKMVRERL